MVKIRRIKISDSPISLYKLESLRIALDQEIILAGFPLLDMA